MVSIRRIACVIVTLVFLLVGVQVALFFSHTSAAAGTEKTGHASSSRHSSSSGGIASFLGFGGAAPKGRGADTCERFEEMDLFSQAELDFARYKDGLSAEQKAAYWGFCNTVLRHSCMTIIILRGRIFVRHFYPGYQSRHRSTLYAIYRVAQRFGPLPDAQFVIEVTDGYLGVAHDLPIFMITRPVQGNQVGVLYPDFTFFSWPEAACPPERSHGYGYLFTQYEQEAKKAELHPEDWWSSKEDLLFWRGGHVHNQNREAAVKVFRDKPGTDMAFMEWKNTSITGINGAPGCVGLLKHCRYRYLAFLDGNTYSSRLKYNLLCGSCVFASRQTYMEWWTRHFKAGEDYVEVSPDWSDAPKKHADVRWSSDGGKKIAESGRQKALKMLSEDAVDCYWLRLIEKAAAILPPPMKVDFEDLPPSTKPIEDVLHYANDVVIDDDGLVGPVVLVR